MMNLLIHQILFILLVTGDSHVPAWIKDYDFVKMTTEPTYGGGMQMNIEAFNMTFLLMLNKHDNELIYPGGTVTVYHSSSNSSTFALEHDGIHDGSVYVSSRAEPVGWARITMVGDDEYEGVFTSDLGMYHLKPISSYNLVRRDQDVRLLSISARNSIHATSTHILFMDSSVAEAEMPIGPDLLKTLFSRQSSLSKRAPAGCPSSVKYMIMAAAADCSYFGVYGDAAKVLKVILADWNAASKVYESNFNVRLALSKVDIQQSCSTNISPTASPPPIERWNQGCSTAYTIKSRLSDFSYWRGKQNDSYGLWHLLTNCPTQPSVGVAWVGTICERESKFQSDLYITSGYYTSGVGVSSIVPVEWKVVAHEIGHSKFVAKVIMQISEPCMTVRRQLALPNALMTPLDTASTDSFSPSSITDICQEIQSSVNCLVDNIATDTNIKEGICGNGVKDGNEECDCGGSSCADDHPCCTSNCKLKPGKMCSDENDSCCKQCQINPAGTLCRPATGFCDLEEKCDGTSKSCPTDLYIADKTSCTNTGGIQAQCASGRCTSREIQCTGRGAINTTSPCPNFYTECKLYCQDDLGTCMLFNGYFIDGTLCGDTGKCFKGDCIDKNDFLEAIGWYKRNLSLALPITIAIIGTLGMILAGGIQRCRRRRRLRQALQSSTPQQAALLHPKENEGPPGIVDSQQKSANTDWTGFAWAGDTVNTAPAPDYAAVPAPKANTIPGREEVDWTGYKWTTEDEVGQT